MGKGNKVGKSRRFVTEGVKMRKWSAVRDSLLLMSLFLFYPAKIMPFRLLSIYACFDHPYLQSFTIASIAIRLALLYICFIETTHTQARTPSGPRLTNTQRGNPMNKTKAFILGLLEFRQSFTTNCGDYSYEYEQGRDFAHFLTFRVFDA